MRILIDIGHPAHVHLFRHFAHEMQLRGHEILFTCRDKEFEIALLEEFGFSYKSFGKKYNSTLGKIIGLAEFGMKCLLAAIRFQPDVFLSHGSIYAAHTAFLLRKPHISLEDTFNKEQIRLYKPFTKNILTSDYDHPLKSGKVIKYAGYHELAYLHPARFTPAKNIIHELGIGENEKYVIMRFVSWKASHDIGHKGIALRNKIKAVKEFSKYAKVLISSESEISPELKPYQFDLSPHKMHDALAHATLVFGESATMVSEATMLGVAGIYLDNTGRYYTNDLEKKYALCFNYTESDEDQQRAIEKGLELLETPNIKQEWQTRREKMLSYKIDVTAFLVWFIENYPASARIMKENPSYQERFR